MGMIRNKSLLSLVCVSTFALLGPACNGGEGDDTGTGGSPDDGSGGKVGTGGKGSADGGSTSGGASSTGGTVSADGGASSGGGPTTGGGTSTGGAAPSGGSAAVGGMGGVPSGGAASDGGSAGEIGYGGEGGAPPEDCGGCLKLFAPLTTASTGTDFIVYTGGVDLTDAVVTFRIKVESEGSGGFYQFLASNDGDLDYASYYSGWQSLSGASSGFIEAVFDLSALSDPATTFDNKDFYKSDVNAFGIQITGGNSADEALGDTTMYVDSITFSDDSVAEFDFATSTSGFQVNAYNSPIAGSTVEWVP